jgi:hypothetical protein
MKICYTCGGRQHFPETFSECPGRPVKAPSSDAAALLAKLRAHPRCVEYVRGYESHARAMAVTRSEDHRSDGEFCGLLAALLRGEG